MRENRDSATQITEMNEILSFTQITEMNEILSLTYD